MSVANVSPIQTPKSEIQTMSEFESHSIGHFISLLAVLPEVRLGN